MAMTKLTTDIEKCLAKTFLKPQGPWGCTEVTIGWFGKERVDFLTYDSKGVFRAYEIKVSMADLKSHAALSFVGHYNYLVVPHDLWLKTKDQIPANVGVWAFIEEGVTVPYLHCVKKAKKVEPSVSTDTLKDSLIRCLARDAHKVAESENVERYAALRKSLENEHKQVQYWQDKCNFRAIRLSELLEYLDELYADGEDWEALEEVVFNHRAPMGESPFTDGRPYAPAIFSSMSKEQKEKARALIEDYAKRRAARKPRAQPQKEDSHHDTIP